MAWALPAVRSGLAGRPQFGAAGVIPQQLAAWLTGASQQQEEAAEATGALAQASMAHEVGPRTKPAATKATARMVAKNLGKLGKVRDGIEAAT